MLRLLLILFVATFHCANAQLNDCTLKLNKDSIKVYTCAVANSKFRAVKTVFNVNSSLSQLAAMVLDIDKYKGWQYKTKSAKVLKKVNEKEIIYYTEVEAPILTSNRDFIIRLTIDQNPQTRVMIIDAVCIPDYLPPVEGVVRVPFSSAKWIVRPLTHTKVSVEYYIEIDLGGAVPPWLVNMVAPKAPYETFNALRSGIKDFKGKKVSFVKD